MIEKFILTELIMIDDIYTYSDNIPLVAISYYLYIPCDASTTKSFQVEDFYSCVL